MVNVHRPRGGREEHLKKRATPTGERTRERRLGGIEAKQGNKWGAGCNPGGCEGCCFLRQRSCECGQSDCRECVVNGDHVLSPGGATRGAETTSTGVKLAETRGYCRRYRQQGTIFQLDLHGAGLHLNDYVEGFWFCVSVAESQSTRQRTLLQDAQRELVAAREGLQEAERLKEVSGKFEGTIATITSERDEQKFEKHGRLRGEAESVQRGNEHL
ncbi:hypothetical protein Efla_007098 [Eimeria flavescens]